MMSNSNFSAVSSLLLALFLLSACSAERVLVETPILYTSVSSYTDGTIPSGLRTTTPKIFFITDRRREISPDGMLSYGAERSAAMAFGTAEVSFGLDLTWEQVVRASSTAKRDRDIGLNVSDVDELVQFPATPLPFIVRDDEAIPLPEEQEDYHQATQIMKSALQNSLRRANSKDVIIFIHGFNNGFIESVQALAELWHFSGRKAVPILYTWPAARGGLFGYFIDRESGEFSIYHLKESIRILAELQEVDRIHIIAHSRGTDITTAALRELIIEARASGNNPRKSLKIENLILAAPDLDFGVVRQRVIAEKFGPAIGQITVYMNQDDEALGLSQYIMSGLRFGKLSKEDFQENDRQIFERVKNVSFINVDGVSSFLGHSYYRTHPGVLSDIALVIRDNLKPGDPARPLIHNQFNFWTLAEGYPAIN